MKIVSIHVENFKSLVDFNLELAKLTCLIGLNGSGKSTVLQLIDFLAQQVRGKLDVWLLNREWDRTELRSKLTAKKNIEFTVVFEGEQPGIKCKWQATFNTQHLRCTSEIIEFNGSKLEVADGKYYIEKHDEPIRHGDERWSLIPFLYQGSIVSQLRADLLGVHLGEFKRFVKSIHSLDLLSPQLLRQRTRDSQGSLGLGGERLSAFLHELKRPDRDRITHRLREVYPQLTQLLTRSLRSGWKHLDVIELYDDKRMATAARHVNDGLLRLCAMLAELQTAHEFVLFDEIENGMNPELVQFLVTTLMDAKAQILVTTHSPMILNYFSDEAAYAGIIYLYKNPQGHTKSIRFFSIPSMAEKLLVMGPGEVFADTNLKELANEIATTAEPA